MSSHCIQYQGSYDELKFMCKKVRFLQVQIWCVYSYIKSNDSQFTSKEEDNFWNVLMSCQHISQYKIQMLHWEVR